MLFTEFVQSSLSIIGVQYLWSSSTSWFKAGVCRFSAPRSVPEVWGIYRDNFKEDDLLELEKVWRSPSLSPFCFPTKGSTGCVSATANDCLNLWCSVVWWFCLRVSTRCSNTAQLVYKHSNLSLNEIRFEIKPQLLLKYLTPPPPSPHQTTAHWAQ